MNCRTDREYRIVRDPYGEVVGLVCILCHSFGVSRVDNMRGTDCSGLVRYNHMRAKMVRHLHSEHRESLIATELGEQARL